MQQLTKSISCSQVTNCMTRNEANTKVPKIHKEINKTSHLNPAQKTPIDSRVKMRRNQQVYRLFKTSSCLLVPESILSTISIWLLLAFVTTVWLVCGLMLAELSISYADGCHVHVQHLTKLQGRRTDVFSYKKCAH